MDRFVLDFAHMLAGGLVLVSFMLLYQHRMFGLLNVFALHAVVLSLSVGWQAYIQSAPHLYITALIALLFTILFTAIGFLLARKLPDGKDMERRAAAASAGH